MLGSAQGAVGGDEGNEKIKIEKLKIIRRDEKF